MSDYRRCKTCGEFDFLNSHKCQPCYEASAPEAFGEDEWQKVYAYDEKEAAEKFAEEYDRDEHDLMNGGDMEVWIRKPGEIEIFKFNCTGEAIPTYYAHKIEKEK